MNVTEYDARSSADENWQRTNLVTLANILQLLSWLIAHVGLHQTASHNITAYIDQRQRNLYYTRRLCLRCSSVLLVLIYTDRRQCEAEFMSIHRSAEFRTAVSEHVTTLCDFMRNNLAACSERPMYSVLVVVQCIKANLYSDESVKLNGQPPTLLFSSTSVCRTLSVSSLCDRLTCYRAMLCRPSSEKNLM